MELNQVDLVGLIYKIEKGLSLKVDEHAVAITLGLERRSWPGFDFKKNGIEHAYRLLQKVKASW